MRARHPAPVKDCRANTFDDTVSIFLGVGAGGFVQAAGSPVAAGTGPVAIAIGDFDGDGTLDLAVANSSSDDVSILLGDGTGGFSPAPGSPVPVGAGPVSVAAGDVNGDGRLDLAVATESARRAAARAPASPPAPPRSRTRPAAPASRSSPTASPARSPSAPTVPGATTSFALLNTGRFVAVGADAGGFPEVKLYDALTGRLLQHFLAYPASFRGGVRVALGDLTGDGVPEIVTAPGPGAPPLVKVFDGASGVELGGFLAYDPAFQGGVFVAAGDLTGDGHADLVTGAGPGGPPHVKVFSGAGGDLLASFFAYDPAFQGGVRVAVTDVTGDGVVDLLTVAGPGAPAFVRVFATSAGGEAARGFVFDPAFAGGAFVNGQ